MAYSQGKIDRAVVLIAALDRVLTSSGSTLPVDAHTPYERTLAAVKPRLEEEQPLLVLWEAGQRMSPEQIVAYALGELVLPSS